MKINTVISGEYEGKNIISAWGGNTYISTSAFGSINLDKANVNDIEIISEDIDEEENLNYKIKIKFKTGEESIIGVDDSIYKKLVKIFPQKHQDRLNKLLSQGYKIVGYTSYFLGSAFGTSTLAGQMAARMQRQHNILLQKDTNVEIVSIIEESVHGKMIERNRTSLTISYDGEKI